MADPDTATCTRITAWGLVALAALAVALPGCSNEEPRWLHRAGQPAEPGGDRLRDEGVGHREARVDPGLQVRRHLSRRAHRRPQRGDRLLRPGRQQVLATHRPRRHRAAAVERHGGARSGGGHDDRGRADRDRVAALPQPAAQDRLRRARPAGEERRRRDRHRLRERPEPRALHDQAEVRAQVQSSPGGGLRFQERGSQ